MKLISITAAAGLLLAAPAFADDDETEQAKTKADVSDALEDGAVAPATAPTLPTQASDRAVQVHNEIAFGQKGALMKTAHSVATTRGQDRADQARADAANRAAQGAAMSAASKAQGEAKAEAGKARAREAGAMMPPVQQPLETPGRH